MSVAHKAREETREKRQERKRQSRHHQKERGRGEGGKGDITDSHGQPLPGRKINKLRSGGRRDVGTGSAMQISKVL